MLLRIIRPKISLAYFYSAEQQKSDIFETMKMPSNPQSIEFLKLTEMQEFALHRQS
jgi:hypothetical protein